VVVAQLQYAAFLEQGNKYIITLPATCNYFHVLGIDRPLMGRLFASGECKRGSRSQVAVLSEPLWKSEFGADSADHRQDYSPQRRVRGSDRRCAFGRRELPRRRGLCSVHVRAST
jgi:hypothetical protein